MERNCTTCVHRDVKSNQCNKGQKAEIYCMGGDYEMWAGEQEKVLDAVLEKDGPDTNRVAEPILDTVDKEVIEEAENNEAFDEPETPYGMKPSEAVERMKNMTVEEVEAGLGRHLTDEETKEFLSAKAEAQRVSDGIQKGEIKVEDLDKALDPQQLQQLEAYRKVLKDVENRPKTDAEGFNGTKFEEGAEAKSRTCQGCKHHSMVGCFLGRYYDCADHGRYLYDSLETATGGVESIEQKEEIKKDLEDIDFIDGIIKDNEKRQQ